MKILATGPVRKSLGKVAAFCCLLLIAPPGAACTPEGDSLDWASIKQRIRDEFPGVNRLQTEDLERMLSRGDEPLLLDARSREEYEVSHLRGASWAPDLEAAREALAEGSSGRAVVVYCSVGYRSAALAKQLTETGVENVYNLEGSIFEWANEGRPVYREDRPVEKVHPFDAHWGRLLNPRLRSEH